MEQRHLRAKKAATRLCEGDQANQNHIPATRLRTLAGGCLIVSRRKEDGVVALFLRCIPVTGDMAARNI